MDPVRRFAALVADPEPDLDAGALAIAAGAHPALEPGRWLAELDRLADGVGSVEDLVSRLFEEEGFTGNRGDYYDPRNSLLPHVLRRRTGIPITLAVVTIEVGRRAGIELEGVGMPGHFLVHARGTEQYLDVFAGGMLLDPAQCEALFRAVTGTAPNVPFGPDMLARTPNRRILARMLENLRVVYRQRHRPADLEWVLRMRLAVPGEPDTAVPLLVELAGTLGEQARWPEGAKVLLDTAEDPDAPVTDEQREDLRLAAKAQLANLN